MRLAGGILVLGVLWYAPWLFLNVNTTALWLAIPFAAANVLIMLTTLITFVNNWRRSSPPIYFVPEGAEPDVAVIIPTAGESVHMVARTAESVLQQKWPNKHLIMLISDDAHTPEMKVLADNLQHAYREAMVYYHEPPLRGSSERRGAAKAGR